MCSVVLCAVLIISAMKLWSITINVFTINDNRYQLVRPLSISQGSKFQLQVCRFTSVHWRYLVGFALSRLLPYSIAAQVLAIKPECLFAHILVWNIHQSESCKDGRCSSTVFNLIQRQNECFPIKLPLIRRLKDRLNPRESGLAPHYACSIIECDQTGPENSSNERHTC